MRIAIIGTGISGLVAAHHLHREHDLTLFEANDYVGGHTHTHSIELDGEQHAIDTGFIVFNEANYPNFCALMNELGVQSQPTSMSFSVRCDRTGLEYNGSSLNQIFAQRRNLFRPSFLGMLRDIVKFGRQAQMLLFAENATNHDDQGDAATVDDFVRERGLGRWFYEKYLVPLGASLWSCPARTFRGFPIRFVAEFLRNHQMLRYAGRPVWRTIRGGSSRYIDPLTRPFRDRIRQRSAVHRVQRFADRVEVAVRNERAQVFDHVILACHADTALAMLADASPLEREVLGAFPYQVNEAILHTDASLLPRRRRAWASWNYLIPRDEPEHVAVTYNMNMLQNLASKNTFCVTLNHDVAIDPKRVLRRIRYDHPVYTTARAKAQRRHGEVIHANRTSFCGAYWGYGFHEDGVKSALAAVRGIQTLTDRNRASPVIPSMTCRYLAEANDPLRRSPEFT